MMESLNKQWKRTGLLLGLAGLAGCGGDPRAGQYVGDTITATNFEQLAGWGADSTALTRRQAHSGQMATFVGPGREFSLTYRLPLERASVHPIKAAELDAWVYLPTAQASASLVVQVVPPGGSGSSSYEELHLLQEVKEFGRWQRVHHVFILPPGLPGSSELRLYLWRATSPETVYLDDLTVKARE